MRTFEWCDELGPARVVQLYEPRCGLRAVVAVDNVACGPAIGGVRMAPDVTAEEAFRLARAMTLKNAAAGLPHGGGKSAILADPAQPRAHREEILRTFARSIRDLVDYIPGPDMGTDEESMAWIHDEIGRAVGLPRVLGGIPLDEIGATGYGLAQCAEVAAELGLVDLDGARVAIEGYGNVGRPAARFLEERGARLVAASDSRGAVHCPDGIPCAELERVKSEHGTVAAWSGGGASSLPRDELLGVDCDILVPAARPDSIHERNVEDVRAGLVLEGANIPATAAAEQRLFERSITVVPDFIANAGGVICASVEFHGGIESDALAQIAEKIRHNTREVLSRSLEEHLLPRRAADELALARVRNAMQLRRP